MTTKKVREKLNIAEFEVPANWTVYPSPDDSSTQYYPEDTDVVLRASALVFRTKDKTKKIDPDSILDKPQSSANALKGKTRAGNPWRKTVRADNEGSHTTWQIVDVQGSSFVLLIFTYSDFLPTNDSRVAAKLADAERAVDSTRFLSTNSLIDAHDASQRHN